METTKHATCVGIFERQQGAEKAIRELQRAGYDMKKLSIVGRDYHTAEHAVGFYSTGDRVKYVGKLGAFWGMVFGIFLAPAFFFIPGIGPILTGGLIGSILMGTVEGAVVGAAVGGGAGALAASLASMGIPKEETIRYEAELKADKYLLIASGSAEDANRARSILAEQGGEAAVHAG